MAETATQTMKTSFPKSQIEIVLLEGTHAAGTIALQEAGFGVRTHAGALEGDALIEEIKRAHVVGLRSKTQITREVIEQCDRLLAIGCFCAGTNQVDLEAAAERGIVVFNSPFSNTRSVAELTIAEIVALHRQLTARSHAAHKGQWLKSASGAHEVRGKTLGIVGYGHIGSQVSILAEAMGMRVLFYDTLSKLPLGNAGVASSLEEVLSKSDVVTLHVPDTQTSRGMIGRAQLAMMKKGAYLINNARGSVVDLEALRDAIESGAIAGAAIDVFPDEPAKNGEAFSCPLQGLENVILTPHVGGSTIEAQEAISLDAASKLARFINMGTTTGSVNVPEVDLPDQQRHLVEGEKRPHRILNFHRNVPGVLGKIHEHASELGINISAQYLQTNQQIGYLVLDADPSDADELARRIDTIEESIRTRMLW
ncbi:MAG: phosphoglycerate dehydrogenase [Phycisphaerales bacterium]|nr:phosphoglycerate dehydrogenase [Phycisphaerales bacterium]